MGERLMHRNVLDINTAHWKRYMFAKRHLKATDSVLDFGCGCGYGTWIMAPYCRAIIGVDKSEEAYKFARTYYMRHNMDYIISKSPVSSNQFDVIVAFEIVEHVKDSLALMTQFYNSLKPGGKLLMSVPNQDVIPFSKEANPFHYRHFTPRELDSLLITSGFKDYKKHYQLSKVQPTIMHGDWIGYTSVVSAKK